MPARDVRVGYVLKMYPRFSETFILNEVLALERAGTEIEILSLRPPADGRFHEALAQVRAPVTYLPPRPRAGHVWEGLRAARAELPDLDAHLDALLAAQPEDALAALDVAVAVRKRGLTHLHAHFGSVATTVARLAARITGVGYTFTAHAKDIFHEDVDRFDLAAKLRDAAAVVTVSDYNERYLREELGATRVVRVYNGLDLTRFTYHPPGDREPTICAVGRLVEKKGFHDLLKAVALLVRVRPGVRVDLVGTGPEEESLRAYADRLGLDEVVRFRGALPQAQVREVVRAAGVFAAPCVVGADGNRDGLPTVLTEALAAGTPCVATPVTGIPEVVRDGETGLLVPEADPTALAGALDRVLSDPDLAAGLAAAGRRLVEREFDIDRNVTRLQELFAGGNARLRTRTEVPA